MFSAYLQCALQVDPWQAHSIIRIAVDLSSAAVQGQKIFASKIPSKGFLEISFERLLHIGVKGGTPVANKLPEVGCVFGKGKTCRVPQRVRAGGPALDPRSMIQLNRRHPIWGIARKAREIAKSAKKCDFQ